MSLLVVFVVLLLADLAFRPASAGATTATLAASSSCTNFVECRSGKQVVAGVRTQTSCHDACLEESGGVSSNCCVFPSDCDRFTGKVCADAGQTSCNSFGSSSGGACRAAKIPMVEDSCQHSSSCENANVGKLISSCHGDQACFNMGYFGQVGDVIGSCKRLPDDFSTGPVIDKQCQYLGERGGAVGNIVNSCVGDESCRRVASDFGTINYMEESCIGKEACQSMALGGSISFLAYSCITSQSCTGVQCQSQDLPGCSPDSTKPGIDIMNGSCITFRGCYGYMGTDDGSGLTCTAEISPTTLYSPVFASCIDGKSGKKSKCEGSIDVCTPVILLGGSMPTTCTNFVDCDGGFQVLAGSTTTTTCHDACLAASGGSSSNCCVSPNDCDGFTGSVCAEAGQKSCDGGRACLDATIPKVENSCQGIISCQQAGQNGKVGDMVDSCQGFSSCNVAGKDGGDVGDIVSSCKSLSACFALGSRGKVGDVNESCKADLGPTDNGLDAQQCLGLGADGEVGDISRSCFGLSACSFGASADGFVDHIRDSCRGNQACRNIARQGGNIGMISYSCNNDKSCFQVQCKGSYSCSGQDPTAPGIEIMNGSCNIEGGCLKYMGNNDGSGLTCALNSTADAYSPKTTPCIDAESTEVSTCDGMSNACTSLCPVGEAFIPSNYWVPPLDKPETTCEHVRLKIPDHGEFTCLPIGEGICRDNGGAFGEWRFGIEEVQTPPCEVTSICRIGTATDTFPVLIDPANTRYPITGTTFTDSDTGEICKNDLNEAVRGCNYAGTTHICISENIESNPNRFSNERPFMFFYDQKSHQYLYQLVCDGIGEEGKLPELKMVNQKDLADATYVDYPVDIVKFKKGATPNTDDSNELWRMYIDWNGFEDPDTRRIGKLASFIGVSHTKYCKEYVSATDKACWKEDCNDGSVATPEAYERDNCTL